MLLNFGPLGLSEAFDFIKQMSSVITLEEDIYGGDIAVVGPNKSKGREPSRIVDELFKYDEKDSPNRMAFEGGVLGEMKDGNDGFCRFVRRTEDGGEQTLVTVYTPVTQYIVSALDPSDLVHGVDKHPAIHSVASIACPSVDSGTFPA